MLCFGSGVFSVAAQRLDGNFGGIPTSDFNDPLWLNAAEELIKILCIARDEAAIMDVEELGCVRWPVPLHLDEFGSEGELIEEGQLTGDVPIDSGKEPILRERRA